MSWSARRRFLILFGIGAIGLSLFALIVFILLHRPPSCTDGKQNQDEQGIDCGGSCAYVCTASARPPVVLFTQSFVKGDGRSDIVASIENQNPGLSAKDVSYTITVYGSSREVLQKISGKIDFPPPPFGKATVYVPNVNTGNQRVVHSFLTIESSTIKWFISDSDPRIKPTVLSTTLTGSEDAPRIKSVLLNTNIVPLSNILVLVLIRDTEGQVISASQTILPSIQPQGQSTAVFSWNKAFSATPTGIEVIPVIPLP